VFDPCQVLESAFSGNCTCQYERLCVLAKPHQKHWGNKYLDQLTGHMEEASESNHHAKMTVRSGPATTTFSSPDLAGRRRHRAFDSIRKSLAK